MIANEPVSEQQRGAEVVHDPLGPSSENDLATSATDMAAENRPNVAGPALVHQYTQPDGSVIIPPRVASWIKHRLGRQLERRINMRLTDPHGYAALTALHLSALEYRSDSFPTSSTGRKSDRKQEVTSLSQEWITTTEAARLTGVTGRTVRNWITSQKLPAKKYGGRWLVSRHHLNLQAMIA